MKATPPVLPAFIPDAGAVATTAATQSTPVKSDGSPTFAGTLKDVGAKAGRRVVTAKAQSGDGVPPAGNSPPPAAAAAIATKPSAPLADAAASLTSGKAPDKQAVSAAPAVTTGTGQTAPPAVPVSATAAQIAGQRRISVPGGVAAAGVTASGTAMAPTDASGTDTDAAPPPAPAVAAAAEPAAAAASGTSAVAAGGKPATATAPLRQSFKAALQHPAAALNPPADPDAGDDVQSTDTSPAADSSTAAAGSTTAPAPLTADGSTAVAVAALAESRTTYSAAAADADADDGPDAAGASSVAGATLTDAAMKDSAHAAVQATLLQGVARADKHTVDAAGTGGAATGTAGTGVAATTGAADAAGVSQPASNVAVVPDTAPTPTVRVAANLDSAEFPQDLSSRVSWMVDNNMNGAKLQVNPPSLGPIELRILVSGDHAQVWMSSHSAVTRDALESSTPTLREMLGTQGFTQVSVDISQRSFQERSAYSPPYEQTSTAGRSGAIAAATAAVSTTTRSSLGIVDAYA